MTSLAELNDWEIIEDEMSIWRYMDITKYLNTLKTNSLYFSTLRELANMDPFEGTLYHMRKMLLPGGKKLEDALGDHTATLGDDNLDIMAVNCWQINESESMAMWQLYSANHYGVAIRSKISNLKKAILGNKEEYLAFLEAIRYIDFEAGLDGDLIYTEAGSLPLYKRNDFKHERELRIILLKANTDDHKFSNTGVGFEIDLDLLIESVYISPLAPSWINDVIDDVNTKYGHKYDIVQSAKQPPEPYFKK